MAENKVVFGLEKVGFAVATIAADGSATYDTPIMNPGARSISLEPQGDLEPWYADNIAYYVVDNFNSYSGDLEVAKFLDDIMEAIWHEAEANNGIRYEEAGTEAVHFALLFEIKGDKEKIRHVFYNCTGTRPAVSGSTTEDSTEPQTSTTSITATSIYVPALQKDIFKGRCKPTDAAYANFYTAVTLPTAPAATT